MECPLGLTPTESKVIVYYVWRNEIDHTNASILLVRLDRVVMSVAETDPSAEWIVRSF